MLNALQLAQLPLNNETIKQHLDSALGHVKKEKRVENKPLTFLTYIDLFVSDAETGKRLNSKSQRYALITINGFIKLKRTLEGYSRETGRGLNYADFSIECYHHLNTGLTDRGLTLNYVGALLKDFKLLLKQSYAEGSRENTVFLHRDFKRLVEEADNVYLSGEELNQLYSFDLSRTTRLDRIRDLFLIGWVYW